MKKSLKLLLLGVLISSLGLVFRTTLVLAIGTFIQIIAMFVRLSEGNSLWKKKLYKEDPTMCSDKIFKNIEQDEQD